MKKNDIKILLILEENNPQYYSEDNNIKKLFMELLHEKFPYAIKTFCLAPSLFIEQWSDFKEKHFRAIWPLYTGNTNEEDQRSYYAQFYKDLKIPDNVFRELEDSIWKLSTLEFLTLYKKWHLAISKKKNIDISIKDFHDRCKKRIDILIKDMKAEKQTALVLYKEAELSFLKTDLISDVIPEEKKADIKNLLSKYEKEAFQVDYFKYVCSNYRSQEALNIYIQALIDGKSSLDFDNLVSIFVKHSAAKKVRPELLYLLLEKVSKDQLINVFKNIDDINLFDQLLKLSTQRINQPDIIASIAKIYLDKFPYSGDAIGNTAQYVTEGKSIVNRLPEIIENHSKIWLLTINSHNQTSEICSVIEGLNTVDKLEELFYDFSFWKKMESCNAFISLVDCISYIVGFDRCYDMIRKNYLTAHIYGANILRDNWMKAANFIATQNEDAQRPYVLFISELTDKDGILDARSKDILTKTALSNMLQLATDNKKLYDLQIEKNDRIKAETLQDIVFHICAPLEKLERTLIAYSTMPGASDDTLKIFRNQVLKLRTALNKVGIHTMVDPADWEKCKIIPFDSNLHECNESIHSGDGVLCLSMGMRDEQNGYLEKALVRLYIEENGNGRNI